MHCYPAYKLGDVLNEYFSSFSYLLSKHNKFVALDRLEQIKIALTPNMKRDELTPIIRQYTSQLNQDTVVDSATINKDRQALRKLLNKK